MQNSTAILFFTRTAAEDAQLKSFVNSKSSHAIATQLIQHTRKIAKNTGLPVFETKTQRGNTFGERLSNAMSDVFDKGYQQVIVIGNDTPTLTSQQILVAQQQLNAKNLVIGPSEDGGIYLLGMHQDAFQKEAFTALGWQTNTLLDSLEQYIEVLGCNKTLLSNQIDIDNSAAFYQVLPQLKKNLSWLYDALCGLFQPKTAPTIGATPIFYNNDYRSSFSLRAPPTV